MNRNTIFDWLTNDLPSKLRTLAKALEDSQAMVDALRWLATFLEKFGGGPEGSPALA